MSARRDIIVPDLIAGIEHLAQAKRKALAGDEQQIAQFLFLGFTLLDIEERSDCDLYAEASRRNGKAVFR